MSRKLNETAPTRVRKKPDPRRRGASEPAGARTLLLRVWQEPRRDSADASFWRGTLTNVEGRQIGTFTTVTDLMQILGEFSGAHVLLQFSRKRLSATDRTVRRAPQKLE